MSRIWIINQFANIPEFAGHTRQYEIAKYLTQKGWEVELFASDYNLSERKFKKLRKYELKLNLLKESNGIGLEF